MSEVRICRYLVFWALKKVKGPNRRVKMLCRKRGKKGAVSLNGARHTFFH